MHKKAKQRIVALRAPHRCLRRYTAPHEAVFSTQGEHWCRMPLKKKELVDKDWLPYPIGK